MSATEYLIDASTRHQIMLQRLSGGAFNKLKPILEQLQKDVKARLRDDPTDFQMHRLTALSADIQALFDEANAEFGKQLNLELNAFTEYETDFQYRMLGNAVTTELTLPAIEQVVSATTKAKAVLISGKEVKKLTISGMVKTLGTKPRIIENRIRAGIIEGKSVDQMVRDIMRIADKVNKRDARTIVRTAFNLAGSEARKAVVSANADIITGEKWVSTLDGRTSDVCIGRDGKVYDVGVAPFPPAHMNCLPGDTNVSTCSDISNVYKRPYKGRVVNIRTKTGRTLSATPNHPILTSRGWVAIGEINLGDKLICCNDVVNTFKNNKQNIIAKIGDIFSASNVSVDSCAITRAPSSTKDFHGDGTDDEVDVISINSLANYKIKSALIESVEHKSLPFGSGVDSTLLSNCPLKSLCVRDRSPSAGNMRISSEVCDLIGCRSGHSSKLLLTPISSFTSCGLNNPFDRSGAAFKVEVSSNTVNTDPGVVSGKDVYDLFISERDAISINNLDSCVSYNSANWFESTAEHLPDVFASNVIDCIEFDDVVDLFFSEFTDTHVYNLENKNNWYIANGIITHNCRSLRVPVVDPKYAIPGIKGLRSSRNPDGTVEQINGETTYNSWLKRQPAEFQDEVLGVERAKLFRGGMNVDKFTDDEGRTLTLEQLKQLENITL